MFKTQLAYENWKNKYSFNGEQPIFTWQRIAKALASVEENPEEWYDKFLRTMVKFNIETDEPEGLKCTTGGRITANAGTSYNGATLINCYINGPVKNATISYKRKSSVSDLEYPVKIKTPDTGDNLHNIFLTLLEQARTLASEGGYGMNFSFIRPRGSIIKGIGIKHPGVLAYMNIWDAVSECIVQGDTDGYKDKIKNYLNDDEIDELIEIVKTQPRKGAMMGVLNIWHPDIEEFIRVKQESGKLQKFNMSVAVDDKFMQAVEENDFYDLHFEGKVHKRIKARDLYNVIMESTYNRGEPGILFIDNMHSNNPISYLGKCLATNPCGEIPGLADLTTVCLLGSLNVTQYVKDDRTFDFDLYAQDADTFVRMLDNVNDIAKNPLPSYDWATKNFRQIGMGLNGLGSALLMMGIDYNSQEGIDFTKKICQLKEDITWRASALLAEEKGVFPAYDKEKFESTEYFKSDRLSKETKKLMRKYGVRNAKTTTNPPLGNSSVICDSVSNGIEPVVSLEYERIRIIPNWPEGLDKENVTDILKEYKEKDYVYWRGEYNGTVYHYEPHNRGLCDVTIVRDYGWQWLLDNIDSDPRVHNVVTMAKLNVDDHLNIQEVVQYYCNQSVSKTVSLPKNYSFTGFKSLYMDAWKKGLNGLATYREGSMESVLSSIENAEKTREIIKTDIKLPEEFLNGPTSIIKREGIKFYINFSYLPEDSDMNFPICMWIYTNSHPKGQAIACNKAARELSKLAIRCGINSKIVDVAIEKANNDEPHNKLGRMISLCLRHNIPRESIYVVISDIEGDNISSLLTAVRKYISNTIADGTVLKGMKCPNPECKSENYVILSGCKQCRDCGHSACG
jgi:ribonucleoside-diphosphate reductase alpha chain